MTNEGERGCKKNAYRPRRNSGSVALEITFGCVEDGQGQETAVIK